MIYIFYTSFTSQLQPKTFKFLLGQLPVNFQYQILKFRNWQDRQRSLLGKSLLSFGLQSLKLHTYVLDDIKFTEYQKPYFNHLIDFNISHSGEYIVCVLSNVHKVGVDIEEIKDVPIADFNEQFSENELKEMIKAENPLRSFYSFWTRKEAFIKAIGKGLQIPLNELEIRGNKISWNEEVWFLKELLLDQKYVSYLATDVLEPLIELKRVDFQ